MNDNTCRPLKRKERKDRVFAQNGRNKRNGPKEETP